MGHLPRKDIAPVISRTVENMITLTTKHLRLSQLRPLAPASVQSLAAAWEVRMVASSDQFTEVRKMILNPRP